MLCCELVTVGIFLSLSLQGARVVARAWKKKSLVGRVARREVETFSWETQLSPSLWSPAKASIDQTQPESPSHARYLIPYHLVLRTSSCYFLHFSWENCGSEKLSILPKVKELISSIAGIQPKPREKQSLGFFLLCENFRGTCGSVALSLESLMWQRSKNRF